MFEMVRRIAMGRKSREIDPALAVLRSCVAEAKSDAAVPPSVRKRLTAMLEFTETVDRSFGEIMRLPAPTLMALIRMGGAIARFAGRKSNKKPRATRRPERGSVPCQPLRSASPLPTPLRSGIRRRYPRLHCGPAVGRRFALSHPRRRGGVGRAAGGRAPPLLQVPRPRRDARSTAATSSRRSCRVAGASAVFSRSRHRLSAAADRRRHRPGAGRRHRGLAPRRAELAAHLHPPRHASRRRSTQPSVSAVRRASRSTWAAASACRCASRVEGGALIFRSAGYFLELGRWRLPIAAAACTPAACRSSTATRAPGASPSRCS